MRKLHLGIAAAAGAMLLSVATVQAQNGDLAAPGTADVSQVTAGTYVVDAGHSLVQWKVNHFGFSDYFGMFGDVEGTLTLDPANIAASQLDVTIPISKVVTASAGLTKHLLKPAAEGEPADFFGDTPADARFKSTQITQKSATEATIVGDLTFNGVTKPVTIDATFTGAGIHPMNSKLNVGFSGKARILRSEFGISYGFPAVTDTVDLEIVIAFEK